MKKSLIYLAITTALNIVLRVITKNSAEIAEWYASHIYPIIVGVAARVNGLFPFSVIEILVFLLAAAIVGGIVILTIKLIRKKHRRKTLLKAAVGVGCSVSTILLMLLFGCEINYNRYEFSRYSGLEVNAYSKEELRGVIDMVNANLHELADKVNVDERGGFVLTDDINTHSRSAMENIGKQYTCLDTYYPRPKPLITSELYLSNATLCGVFSPFTIEANYNKHMTDSEKPFTVCHELSHLSGFMREDEANFIAYIACRESESVDFRYSAYVSALVYSINAYYGVCTNEEYVDMYANIPPQVRNELELRNEYWRPYRNKKSSEIADTINDAYLKSSGQPEGVKSYGRFVDLLIADFYDNDESLKVNRK